MAGSLFPQFPIFKSGLTGQDYSGLSRGFDPNRRINPLLAPENPPTIGELSSAPGLTNDQLTPSAIKTQALITNKRDTPDTDAYREFLRTGDPDRKDHQLSTLGKILATAAGSLEGWNSGAGRGIQVGQGLMDKPYTEALGKYERKGGRLKELAGIEQSLLTEEEKRRLANEELLIKQGNLIRENRLADNTIRLGDSTIHLNNERMRDLQDQAKVRGLIWQKNEETGESGFVDPRTNKWTSAGKFYETITAKDIREKDKFKFEEGIRQSNAIYLHNLDNKARQDLEGFKDQLYLNHPEQRQKATELAFSETLLHNADLAEKLFYRDEKGNWIPKGAGDDAKTGLDAIDPTSHRPYRDYQQFFNDKLKQRINNYGGQETVSDPMVRPGVKVESATLTQDQRATQQRIIDWNASHGPEQQMDPNSYETLVEAKKLFDQQDKSDKEEGTRRGKEISKARFGSTTNPILANMGWTGTLPTGNQESQSIATTGLANSPANRDFTPLIPQGYNYSKGSFPSLMGTRGANQPIIPDARIPGQPTSEPPLIPTSQPMPPQPYSGQPDPRLTYMQNVPGIGPSNYTAEVTAPIPQGYMLNNAITSPIYTQGMSPYERAAAGMGNIILNPYLRDARDIRRGH